mgnify:CR=1 FL=1
MKTCKSCNEAKNLNQFHKDLTKKDGVYSKCKHCEHSFYLKNKQRIIKRGCAWRKKNRDELNIFFWRKGALRHKTSGEELQKQFFIQDKKCFYCGIELNGDNLQIEHYNPKDKNKLVISCCDCNRLKWNRKGDDFIKFLQEYKLRLNNR